MTCDYEQLYRRVNKPAQYLGSELNAVQKKGPGIQLLMALAFPDLYEIGMSHLGLNILYHILNGKEAIAAERVYAPASDYIEELEKLNLPLASLESKTPLNQFDAVGFTLQYELTYTNILLMLSLGKIPIHTAERGEGNPLIIGGGPCAFNPEPISQFFDLFLIGDGEEGIVEIAEMIASAKKEGLSREDTKRKLSEIEGVYVPELYEVSYHDSGAVREIRPKNSAKPNIKKRLLKDLNQIEFPTKPIVSFVQLVHDRLSVEIDRGCTQGCRFCQAGIIYRPVRERSSRKVEELLDKALAASGYEELSLLSLSSGDYSRINFLVPHLLRKYREKKIALSLPSLRPGTIHRDLMEAIKTVRKTGFTISAEAGTARLRQVLNKNISEEDILKTVTDLASLGWEHLKLYFMISLPTETEEDIREIEKFCKLILTTANQNKKQIKNINLGIGIFVPKAHTPFQWIGQESLEAVKEKVALLNSLFKRKREFSLKKLRPEMSFLEAVMAKGDRRMGKVIAKAFEKGCRFDGWGEWFRFELWQKSFEDCGLDPTFYANRNIPLEETLPWSHIHSGISEEYLKKEYQNAFQGTVTEDCRTEKCQLCGMESECKKVLAKNIDEEHSPALEEGGPYHSLPSTVRMRFKKTGSIKYISHLDLTRVFHRACQRAGLPLFFSQGFHPHPKISYASALSLGVESLAEYAEIQFNTIIDSDLVQKRLNDALPEGIEILEAKSLPPLSSPLSNSYNKIDYEVTLRCGRNGKKLFEDWKELEDMLQNVFDADEMIIERIRKGKTKKVNLRPFIGKIEITEFSESLVRLGMILLVIDSKQVQPKDILKKMVGAGRFDEWETDVVKQKVHFQ